MFELILLLKMNSINEITSFEENAVFYQLLGNIIDQNLTEENFEKYVKEYIKNKELSSLEEKLFELFLILNPTKENFFSDINKEFIFNILNYLTIKKKKKEIPKATDLVDLFSEKIFKDDPLFSVLFCKKNNLCKQESLYLEMLLMFIPDKKLDNILLVMEKYFEENDKEKEQTINFLKILFEELDLNTIESFQLLKNILLRFLQNKNNIINSIKQFEKDFCENIKNDMLHCPTCYELPLFSINEEKKISIIYNCGHIDNTNVDYLKKIAEHQFKCLNCQKILVNYKKNYLCSNCNSLFCSNCCEANFKECLTIFFHSLNGIESICIPHKEKYKYFCNVCNINCCEKCKNEHWHILKEMNLISIINKENKAKIYDFISNDNRKNNQIILKSIDIILSTNKYNMQFVNFIFKFLDMKDEGRELMFNEFFGEDFKNYYSKLILQIQNGSYYAYDALQKILEEYELKHIEINEEYYKFSIKMTPKFFNNIKNINSNHYKLSLLSKYIGKINEIKTKKELNDLEREIDSLTIQIKENEILIKALLKSENFYQNELMKLVNRSIADTLIRFLIEKYSNKFRKIKFNNKIYHNLQEIYEKKPEKLQKIEKDYKDKINDNIDKLKDKINNDKTEIAGDAEKYQLCFENKIEINNTQMTVDELNVMLEYLFFIKERGNDTAHPNKKNNYVTPLNGNSNNEQITKSKYNDLEKEKKRIKEYLEKIFIKRCFKTPINSNKLCDCLFSGNIKNLLEIKEDENDEVLNKLFSDLFIDEFNEEANRKFQDLRDNIEHIKDICISLKKLKSVNLKKKKENIYLKEFYKRLNKVIKKEKNLLTLLHDIPNLEFKSSIIGDNYQFISDCFDKIIDYILNNFENTFNKFRNSELEMEKLYITKKSIINMIKLIIEKLKNYNPFNEEKIKLDDILKLANSNRSEEDKLNIKEDFSFENLQIKFKELIKNKTIDWTSHNKEKILTLLFRKQNNY